MPLGANKAAIMGVAGVSTADVVLLNTVNITSATSEAEFTGISSAYGEYIFGFYNVHPATSEARLSFQMDDNGGSNGYNDFNITTALLRAAHYEDNSNAFVEENTAFDQSESTAFANLGEGVGNDPDDEHISGKLHVFNPSSTTYVKHFLGRALEMGGAGVALDFYAGGYINTTTALNAIKFKFTSGDIINGLFKMWGVK